MSNPLLTTTVLTALFAASSALASDLFIRNAFNASSNTGRLMATFNHSVPWLKQNISAANEELSMEISNAIGISFGLKSQHSMDIEVEYINGLTVNRYEFNSSKNTERAYQQMVAEEESKKFLFNVRHYFAGPRASYLTPFVAVGSGVASINIKTGIGPTYDDIKNLEIYHKANKKAVIPIIQSGGGVSMRIRKNLELTASYLSLRMLQKSQRLQIKNTNDSLSSKTKVSKIQHSQRTISAGLKVKF